MPRVARGERKVHLFALSWILNNEIAKCRGHDKNCTQIHATLDVSRTQTNEESVAGRSDATVGPSSVWLTVEKSERKFGEQPSGWP